MAGNGLMMLIIDVADAVYAVDDKDDVGEGCGYYGENYFFLRFLPWNSTKPLGGMR